MMNVQQLALLFNTVDWLDCFSRCSVTCGGGNQTRTRECMNAIEGLVDCVGETIKARMCNTRVSGT